MALGQVRGRPTGCLTKLSFSTFTIRTLIVTARFQGGEEEVRYGVSNSAMGWEAGGSGAQAMGQEVRIQRSHLLTTTTPHLPKLRAALAQGERP